ncbi:hypothetical protein BE221DRAFT_69786 [Ostreococcus tauri]|uniref:J domain-containing protein n=1 Tax=Ostreococcus tauri TaxID=70448 RepID=A0A1Y5IM38_OSTTA|nr:hypothetical protein BE221DRAFT_69786 [Ostreococcus tauri]
MDTTTARASTTGPNARSSASVTATPLVAALAVAGAALAARRVVIAIDAMATEGFAMTTRRAFYHGGFEPTMTRREAGLILGVREGAARARVLEAHRRVMTANHPDAGGSAYLSTKVNEAKATLLRGKTGRGMGEGV